MIRNLAAFAVAAVLEIAGAGDYRPALERLAASLDLGGHVRFLGFVSEEEKLALLRRSWAVALASGAGRRPWRGMSAASSRMRRLYIWSIIRSDLSLTATPLYREQRRPPEAASTGADGKSSHPLGSGRRHGV